MTSTDEVFEIKDGAGASVVFDLRFLPSCYLTYWSGTPSIALADAFYKARENVFGRVRAAKVSTVQITDLTNITPPPATVRKHMTVHGTAQDSEHADVFAGYINVVPNAIIRGVLTAMTWLGGGDEHRPVVVVGSLQDAFNKEFKQLGFDGRKVPFSPVPR
jgi:hypothetical protein